MLAIAWRGEAWWKAGDARRAALDYEAVLPAQPGALWNARLKRGAVQESYFMLDNVGGKRVKAFHEDLDAGVAASSRDAWAWAFRGRCRADAGMLEEAAADLGRALALDASHGYALSWRGEVLRRQGRLDAALADLNLAPVVATGIVARWAWARLGRVLAEQGRHREAVVAFDKALSPRDQRFAVVAVWRGESLWAQDLRDEATASFRQAFVLDGKCHEAEEWLRRVGGRRALALAA